MLKVGLRLVAPAPEAAPSVADLPPQPEAISDGAHSPAQAEVMMGWRRTVIVVFRCQDPDVVVVHSWDHCLLGLHFWCLQDCVLGLFAKGLVQPRSV